MQKRHAAVYRGLLILFTIFLAGCGGSSDNSDNPFFADENASAATSASTPAVSTPSTTATTQPTASTAGAFTGDASKAALRVLAVGDSNTRGFGVTQPWPDKLEIALGQPVFRRGVDFEFSADLLTRIEAEIDETNPTHVCIQHGVNDTINKVDPNVTIGNLAAMIDICNARGIPVVIATLTPLVEFFDAEVQATRLAVDERIAPMAAARGARVARISEALGEGTSLIIEDGVHLNDAGHALVAAVFETQLP